MDAIMSYAQGLGFLPAQVEFAMRHATTRRLLQSSPREGDDMRRRYRITTVGAYTYKKLMGTFVYLDAVIVDTPIVDEMVAQHIDDCSEIGERVVRAKVFAGYLDESWEAVGASDQPFSWPDVCKPLERDYERIERTLHKAAQLELESQ